MDIVQRNDPFFMSEAFLQYNDLYCGMVRLLASSFSIIRADDARRIIFAQLNEAAPVWIWTEEDTGQSVCDDAAKLFYANFAHRESLRIIARPSVGAYIAAYFCKMKNLMWNAGLRFEGFRIKQELPDEKTKHIVKLNYIDDMTLSKVVLGVPAENRSQVFKSLYLDMDEVTIDIEELYVYQVDQQIQGLLSIDKQLDGYGKISDIYLIEEARGRDVGMKIIMNAADIIARKQLIPLLFTDRTSGYTRLIQNDPRFINIGSLDEIIIYK